MTLAALGRPRLSPLGATILGRDLHERARRPTDELIQRERATELVPSPVAAPVWLQRDPAHEEPVQHLASLGRLPFGAAPSFTRAWSCVLTWSMSKPATVATWSSFFSSSERALAR